MFLHFVSMTEVTLDKEVREEVPVNHQLVFPAQHLEADRGMASTGVYAQVMLTKNQRPPATFKVKLNR